MRPLLGSGLLSELISDLEQRAGLMTTGVDMHEINFLKDTAKISIRVDPQQSAGVLVHSLAKQDKS